MANNTIDTNYFGSEVELGDNDYRDEVLTFAGAGSVLQGTLLGRVTSTGKLKPYASASNDGSQNVVAVMGYQVDALAAGDVSVRPIMKGSVNRNRLIIALDGNGTNITPALLDQLRDYGIFPVDVQQIGQVS